MIATSRRSFITGLVSFVAAPAIVRAGSLMPVKVMEPTWTPAEFERLWNALREDAMRRVNPPYGLSPVQQVFPDLRIIQQTLRIYGKSVR